MKDNTKHYAKIHELFNEIESDEGKDLVGSRKVALHKTIDEMVVISMDDIGSYFDSSSIDQYTEDVSKLFKGKDNAEYIVDLWTQEIERPELFAIAMMRYILFHRNFRVDPTQLQTFDKFHGRYGKTIAAVINLTTEEEAE